MISAEDLATPRAEGKVALAMSSGFWGLDNFPQSFSEFKRVVGLSDPALAKALKKLSQAGVLERTPDGRYRLNLDRRSELQALLRPFYSGYYIEQARFVVERLRRFREVAAVVVFGSAAQGKAAHDSDADLLIVLRDRDEKLEKRIGNLISELCLERNVSFEQVFISLDGFKTAAERELQFFFGLVEGWHCLLDRANVDSILRAKEGDIRRKYEYDEEVRAWLPKK